jgi:hypothetical protein
MITPKTCVKRSLLRRTGDELLFWIFLAFPERNLLSMQRYNSLHQKWAETKTERASGRQKFPLTPP